MMRRRTGRALLYHLAVQDAWANAQAWAAVEYGEALMEYWANLCWMWRERLREYLTGVEW